MQPQIENKLNYMAATCWRERKANSYAALGAILFTPLIRQNSILIYNYAIGVSRFPVNNKLNSCLTRNTRALQTKSENYYDDYDYYSDVADHQSDTKVLP